MQGKHAGRPIPEPDGDAAPDSRDGAAGGWVKRLWAGVAARLLQRRQRRTEPDLAAEGIAACQGRLVAMRQLIIDLKEAHDSPAAMQPMIARLREMEAAAAGEAAAGMSPRAAASTLAAAAAVRTAATATAEIAKLCQMMGPRLNPFAFSKYIAIVDQCMERVAAAAEGLARSGR